MSNVLNVAETIAQLPTMHWSVARYHDMIAAGVFDDHDKVELLFGKITRMSPIEAQHGKVVNRLLRIFSSALPASDYTLVYKTRLLYWTIPSLSRISMSQKDH